MFLRDLGEVRVIGVLAPHNRLQWCKREISMFENAAGCEATYTVSLQNNIVLLADVDNRPLLAPWVQFNLIDSWRIAGVDHGLQVFNAKVADARRLDFALGLELFEGFPQVSSAFWTRARSVNQKAIDVSCNAGSICQRAADISIACRRNIPSRSALATLSRSDLRVSASLPAGEMILVVTKTSERLLPLPLHH